MDSSSKNSLPVFFLLFEKVGSILLSACPSICPFVCQSVQKKIQARVLKFHIWIPRQKIAYLYFFFLSELSPLAELCLAELCPF